MKAKAQCSRQVVIDININIDDDDNLSSLQRRMLKDDEDNEDDNDDANMLSPVDSDDGCHLP